MATSIPPNRPDDAPSAEDLIFELSEYPFARETVVCEPDAVNEIIMMCRAYVVSVEGRLFAREQFNKRRH